MRNLKKILALVLALVMSFSLMATANAFTDSDKINGTYEEAVEVLSGLKVFQGYDNGSFVPQGSITRAEVAAIIYRIVTGDVTDKQVGIYADYNKFNDVKSTSWYAGYVNFCANAEYIKGYDAKTFGPNDPVTGYQALAMILRAVGYDKNGEFTGTGWQTQTAAVGKKLGITDNVSEGTLGVAATREVVAELLFRSILVPQVEYTVAFGYQSIGQVSIGYETFKLVKGDRTTIDNWGRPGYQWFAYNNKTVVATIEEAYKAAYNVAVTECDVAKAIGQTGTKTYDLYDNNSVKTGTMSINALAQNKIGAQGQVLEVYADRIVVIDTLLAMVTEVKDATYDVGGHLKTPATITLAVYETNTNSYKTGTTTYILTNGATNYTYTAGSMVLLNAHLAGDKVIKNWQNIGEYGEILKAADTIDGAQTLIWYNASQHTVNGTTYNDAVRFHLDEAVNNTTNYTWYFDQFGNLIGNTQIATQYSYAAVKNMWWAGDPATGLGSAKATLVYMDGSENVVTVSGIKTNGKTAFATPVYSGSYAANVDMTYSADSKLFYVASYQYSNAVADGADGVILDNLFRVSPAANDTVFIEEVTTEQTAAHITSKYAVVNGTASKTGAASFLTNVNTQYLLYNTTTQTFETFAGFNAVPNFVTNTVIVDYVIGANNYAQYVYLVGTPDSITSRNFVMVQNPNHSAVLQNNGIAYYEVTMAMVGGEQTTLKVKVADKTTVLDVLMNTANLNKLYYVVFTGEYATALYEISGVGMGAPALPNLDANLRASKLADSAAQPVVRTGNDLAWGRYHFNVTDATEIVGTLPEGRQTGMNVFVISNVANNVAEKIYVVPAPQGPITDTTPYMTLVAVNLPTPIEGANVKDYTATVAGTRVTQNGVESNPVGAEGTKATVVWYLRNASTGNYELFTGETFVKGDYRAFVTVSTTATLASENGRPIIMSPDVVVNANANSTVTAIRNGGYVQFNVA